MSTPDDVTTLSASALATAIRERRLSAVEILEAHAAQVEAINPVINAIVLPRLDEALAEARAADAAVARGERLGPLHGVPFTVKDPLPVAGMPSPNGSLLFARRVCEADCEPVARLRAAGAILLGKTNVSEFSAFWDSTNRLFGSTLNPHDVSRTAGGSSGGEAAALAARMTPLGVGSDLGGSIRAPCHFTGVLGLKPGRHVVPFAAHHPLPSSPGVRLMAAIGPMARHAEDLRLAFDALADAVPAVQPPAVAAVFEEDGLQPVSAVCREAVRTAAGVLEECGWRLVEDRPPGQADARAVYDEILTTELAVAVPAIVGDQASELSPYLADVLASLAEVSPSLEAYLTAFDRLAELEAAAERWLARHAIALCPVVPDVAPPVGQGTWPPIDGEPARPGGKFSLSTYANALGLPSVAVPVARSPDGLPVGVQLFAGRGGEATLVAAAERLERALGGAPEPPPLPLSRQPVRQNSE